MELLLGWLLSMRTAWCVKKKWVYFSVVAITPTTKNAPGLTESGKQETIHIHYINRKVYVIARIRNSKKN